jgi:hypothetical protein
MLYGMMRSPTEYESTPLAAELMQEYMLRLMHRYRNFIRPEEPAGPAEGGPSGSPTLGRRSLPADSDLLRYPPPLAASR